MKRQNPLTDLAAAIAWAQDNWTVRTLPLRLHEGGVEPDSQLGAPRAAAAFMRYLLSNPDDIHRVWEREPCFHPQMTDAKRDRGELCPDCGIVDDKGAIIAERGIQERTRTRYRFPMWRALRALANASRTDERPAPIILVAALVLNAWEPQHAAAFLEMEQGEAETKFLMALRKLHSRYEDTPAPRPSWVDMSDSQRNAVA